MLTLEAQEKRRQERRRQKILKGQTHFNQQITAKTKKGLEKLCKQSKLSKPMH